MKEELERAACPLCGGEGAPHWCYPLPETNAYSVQFNPIRLWMRCGACNHLYSRYFPEKLFLYNDTPRQANPAFFPMYSRVLTDIRGITAGGSLFEVGVGACECLLVAREIGYDAFGIDVIERHVADAREKYGLSAETADFLEFDGGGRQWDVIVMGDVLEHVTDPVRAIEKARDMLAEDGALWISTPNFESAFSAVAGHGDAMRRQTFHLNYFSRDSLYRLLDRCGMVPVDYQLSAHYNGSMEVTCVKKREGTV